MHLLLERYGKEEKHTVLIPASGLTPDGKALLKPLLLKWLKNQQIEAMWMDIGPEWIVRKGKFPGTLPKRINKWFYVNKIGEIDTLENELGKLGQKLAEQCDKDPREVTFDVTDTFNWRAGDFADTDSCYWGGNTMARQVIHDLGGIAIRTYKKAANGKTVGEGRCWSLMVPEHASEMMVIYNGYGRTTVWFARTIAFLLGSSYKQAPLTFNGHDNAHDHIMYVNAENQCYAVGPQHLMEKLGRINIAYDKGQYDPRYRMIACNSCGNQYIQAEMVQVDGGFYCHACLKICDGCGTNMPKPQLVAFGGKNYCTRCQRRFIRLCSACSKQVHVHDLIVTADTWKGFCASCAAKLLSHCKACGAPFASATECETHQANAHHKKVTAKEKETV